MIKIFKSIAIVAVAAASLMSCDKDVISAGSAQKEYTYTFSLSNPDSKAFLDLDYAVTKWENRDQLGVYTVGTNGTSYNMSGDIDSDTKPVKFNIKSYYALAAEDRVYCYFPYDANNSKGEAQNPAKVNLSIPTTQNGKMNAMPMVSVPYTMTSSVDAQTNEPIADINMRNLGGVFQFNIYSTNAEYQTETIESVEFNANAAIAGSFVYDITQEELSPISGYTEKTVTVEGQNLAIAANKEDASKVLMVVAPGTHNGSLVVTTDVAIYTLNFSSAKTVERSHVKPLNVNIANASRELRPTGSVTKTMSEIVEDNGYTVSSGSNVTCYTSLSLNNVVTMSTSGKANCGSFWNNNNTKEWRLYQSGSGNLILTLAEGYKMTSVTFVYSVGNNGLLKYGNTNLSSNVAFTGIKGLSTATFDVSASSGETGQVKLTAVTVAYTSGEIEKDDATWLVDPSSITVMEGKTATAVFTTDYDGTLNIVSDDAETATVSVEGKTITVSGVKEGRTTLSVSGEATAAFKAISKTIDVTVEKKGLVDPTVTIDSEVTVVENETKELTLTTNYDGEIHVVSDAEETATVVYEGGKVKISGVAAGSTTVTVSGEATAEYNEFSKDIAVTVEAAPTDVVYFYESFNTNNGTGGNDGYWNGTIATSNIAYDKTGWSVVSANGAYKCAKFGAGGTKGSATTPAIDIKTTRAKLQFKAGAWSGDAKTLNVSVVSGTATLSQSSVTLADGAWTKYTLDLTEVSGSIKIKFEANVASKNRFFLDEVYVYYGQEPEEVKNLSSLEWTGYTSSYNVGDTFAVDGIIKAVFDNGDKKTLTKDDVTIKTEPDMSKNGSTSAVITYTYDGVTKEATANITVKGSSESGSVTKIMSSFSATSGNVAGDLNVSYEATKGNAGTAPAVSNNEIRVYQNGGLFTVSAKNGCTITEVKLGSSMATTVTYAVDGGTASSNQSISASGKLSVGNLSCTDSIVFTCKGTDKSSRLYVNYLEVTYTPAN